MLTPPYTPELLDSVREYLEAHLSSVRSPRVLEYGSGWSTLWFALNGAEVLSFEHDFGWWLNVTRTLKTLKVAETVNVLLTEPSSFRDLTSYLPFNYFDLCYVDCIDGERNGCALAGGSKLRDGGLLVLDDTHWERWGSVFESLPSKGFVLHHEFWGDHLRKDGTVHHHQTRIYRRKK